MKAWLLFMASAVFLLCINQRAFAGCTDQDDLNGTACRASGDCTPCGSGGSSFGGIQGRQTSPLLDTKPLRASSAPVERTSPTRSVSVSLAGLSLLALLFSPVILYRSQPDKGADLIAEKRGRS